MPSKTIVVSINAAWNIVNFRLGLIRALQSAGHRVLAVAPSDAYADRLTGMGIPYFSIEIDKKGVSPARDMVLLWRYWRLLGRLKPDVFLGYTAKPNIYGSLAAQARGIRVVNNVSGLGTAFLRGGLLARIVSMLYRRAFRRSAVIFFQNRDDRDLFLEKGLVLPQQARLLPGSGIDVGRFEPRPPESASKGGFTFLLIARILWDKGVGEYVEAARLVRGRFPEARFQLLGFLDSENRTAVPGSDVERWSEEGVIDYLGAADDVRSAIAAADCVVLPSYREGLPRSLLEAAAMAKPLIAADVPGCRDVVRPGLNGLLCEVRNARALADAMCEMIAAGTERRAAWGAAGRALVVAEFDERIVIDRYLAAIEEAAD